MKNRIGILIVVILLVSFFLNAFGISWGLPYRWNVDEDVNLSLRLIGEKTIFTKDTMHPPFYRYVLAVVMVPYLLFMKLIGFDFVSLNNSASVSWLKVVRDFPDFANGIFLYARLFSAFLGIFTVFLVYLIGKNIDSKRLGLFSALTLALTQGFVAVNHFAKTTALVNFLSVLAVYLCIKALKNKSKSFRSIGFAAFVVGLTIGTKYNAAILCLPIFLTYAFLQKNQIQDKKGCWISSAIFKKESLFIFLFLFMGLLFSWPTLFIDNTFLSSVFFYHDYFLSYKNAPIFLVRLLNNLIQIVYIFGIPFFVFLLIGIYSYFRDIILSKKNEKNLFILFITVFVYFMVVAGYRLEFAYTKFLILIVPLLSIFVGKGFLSFLRYQKFNLVLRKIIISTVFIYSFFFCLNLDWLFKKGDIRYLSTSWLIENTEKDTSIEHIQQAAWLYSPEILRTNNVIYYGNNSEIDLFRVYQISVNKQEHYKKLLKNGSPADFFMIFTEYNDYMNKFTIENSKSNKELIKCKLLRGEFDNFVLKKEIKARNFKIINKRLLGLSYPKNLFWYPFYDGYYPSNILIYEKNK